jgi:hypothetical protein
MAQRIRLSRTDETPRKVRAPPAATTLRSIEKHSQPDIINRVWKNLKSHIIFNLPLGTAATAALETFAA